ncbi:hypothetical protein DIPPA_14710 [Diplonema papillatum]|nr:hypothetical protein DIPPA_14710 [Diplonema papillatum]
MNGALQSAKSTLALEGTVDDTHVEQVDVLGNRKLTVLLDGGETKVGPNQIHIVFTGDWATACSFLSKGDNLSVSGFDVSVTQDIRKPFEALVTDLSRVVIKRERLIILTAEDVPTFDYGRDKTDTERERLPPRNNPAASGRAGVCLGANQYLKMGRYYDVIYGGKEEFTSKAQFVLSIISRRCKKSVLDLACGSGLYSFFLRYYDVKVTGVDASPALLKVAQEKLQFQLETEPSEKPAARFVAGEMSTLALTDAGKTKRSNGGEQEFELLEQFDCILCLDSLQLLPSVDRVQLALRRAWYHLEPSGILLVSIPNTYHPSTFTVGQEHRRHVVNNTGALTLSAARFDRGALDVIVRTQRLADEKRRVDFIGSALLCDSSRNEYFAAFEDSVEELLITPSVFEGMLDNEKFEVLHMYGDLEGSDYNARVSLVRYYVCPANDVRRSPPR